MVLPFLSDESDHAITQYRKGMLRYPTRVCFAIPQGDASLYLWIS